MSKLWKKLLIFNLFMLSALFLLGGCELTIGRSSGSSNDAEIALLREIQAEIAELRAENNELRESNDLLLQNLEELQSNEPSEPDAVITNNDAPPQNNADAANEPIVVEIHVVETPEPTPSPTPPPASLTGRWATIGATRDGASINVPPEQSMEINLFANGTGTMRIEGTGNPFTWTGGDSGATGRIVMNFTSFFGNDSRRETMTYQISGSRLYLTHTIFDETITTIFIKEE